MKKSACFTGHRNLPKDITLLQSRLIGQLETLIADGVTDFYAGGALGFDMLAEQTVLKLREKYPKLRLHLILPCPFEEQTSKWTEAQKNEYKRILSLSNTVEYTSDNYYNGCMKVRNARLVDLATECCVCYWNENNNRSGTAQTVHMAMKKGLTIDNVKATQIIL